VWATVSDQGGSHGSDSSAGVSREQTKNSPRYRGIEAKNFNLITLDGPSTP
jgi:hypothetical protein